MGESEVRSPLSRRSGGGDRKLMPGARSNPSRGSRADVDPDPKGAPPSEKPAPGRGAEPEA